MIEIDEAAPANLVPYLMSKADVAKRLAMSIRKVQGIVASGRLPIVRIDGCVRFREEDVQRFVEKCRERIVEVVPARDLVI